MIQHTIANLEDRLRNTAAMPEENRRELLALLAKLRQEMDELAKTHAEQAESIAAFTELSAREATRQSRNPKLVELSLEGLQSSAADFEQSHPRLVQVVNSIATALSNLGI